MAYNNPNAWTLVDNITGEPVALDTQRETLRGERVTLLSWQPPHKPGSTGRVYVEDANGVRSQFYPSVVNTKLVLKD